MKRQMAQAHRENTMMRITISSTLTMEPESLTRVVQLVHMEVDEVANLGGVLEAHFVVFVCVFVFVFCLRSVFVITKYHVNVIFKIGESPAFV